MSVSESTAGPPKSDIVDQNNPKRYYVYAHVDKSDNIFYIGRGVGRRAWSKNRHSLWWRYVENDLNGEYSIKIIIDGLSESDSEDIESAWISYYDAELVNWINSARSIDYEALEMFHGRRNANRALMQKARKAEKTNPEKAVEMYIETINAIEDYRTIQCEGGLVGRLIKEETEKGARFGEINAIDRLSLCLIRLGRAVEASERVKAYFKMYNGDLNYAPTSRIEKRIAKALAKSNRKK